LVGGHGPVFGNFDVFLFEDHVALSVGDLGETAIPFDFVVGRDAKFGEQAAEGQAGGGLLAGRVVACGERGCGELTAVVLTSGIAFSISN